MIPVATDEGDAGEAMLAFGGMLGDTEIPVDRVNIDEGIVRFLIVFCIGNVPAVFCCWEFIRMTST